MRILENGSLYHCYYGAKIVRDDMRYYNLFRVMEFASNFLVEGTSASMHALAQECPTRGRGDFRAPAIIVQNENGRSVNELKYKEHRIIDLW